MCHVYGRYVQDAIRCWYRLDQSFNSTIHAHQAPMYFNMYRPTGPSPLMFSSTNLAMQETVPYHPDYYTSNNFDS